MRVLIVAAVLLAAACSVETNGKGGGAPDAQAGGYRLEVRADDANQIYLVTAPDGRTTAALASHGVSTLLDSAAIHALAAIPATETTVSSNDPHAVSLRAPGVSIQASGDDSKQGDKSDGQAHIAINFGGHGFQLDANGHDGGDANRAHLVLTGVDEDTARDFITDADEISPAVQAQMLAAIGLH